MKTSHCLSTLVSFSLMLLAIVVFGISSINTVTEDAPSVTMQSGTAMLDNHGIPMVLVPSATFTMGMDIDNAVRACETRTEEPCYEDLFLLSSPAHEVNVQSFWIDQYEVTYDAWKECIADEVCPPLESFGQDLYSTVNAGSLPFVVIDIHLAKAYCEWRGSRLPTEAEWEYAASGPDKLTYPWGNEFTPEYGNIRDKSYDPEVNWNDGYRKLAPVGSFPMDRSWINVYDMFGNVAEFVDANVAPYPGHTYDWQHSAWNDPSLKTIIRGGNYFLKSTYVFNQWRTPIGEQSYTLDVGFRCARTADSSMPAPN